jgi:hypothetical protein
MKPFVDLVGSGENNTTIFGQVRDSGLVEGAPETRLAHLTLLNTPTIFNAVGINSPQGMIVEHVTIISQPQTTTESAFGVRIPPGQSITLNDVTINTQSNGNEFGVDVLGGSAFINQSVITTDDIALRVTSGGTAQVTYSRLNGTTVTQVPSIVTSGSVSLAFSLLNTAKSGPNFTCISVFVNTTPLNASCL